MAAVSNLQSRLASLADTASKETVQTLSKYISFNRKKFGSDMIAVLLSAIESAPSSSRKVLLLTVAHEVLVADSSISVGGGNLKKWDRNADFRALMGENLAVPAAESIRDAAAAEEGGDAIQRVKDMVDAWEEINAFGGPTIALSVRRALAAPARRSAPEETPRKEEEETKGTEAGGESAVAVEESERPAPQQEKSADKATSPDIADAEKKSSEDTLAGEKRPEVSGESDEGGASSAAASAAPSMERPGTPPPSPTESTSGAEAALVDAEGKPLASAFTTDKEGDKKGQGGGKKSPTPPKEVKFDFEAEGIAPGKVEARELLEPCKALASMQIARDLRNDATAQLTAILGAMPEGVMETCRKRVAAKEEGKAKEEEEEDEEAIPVIPDDVLDLDLEETLASVREYRDIISRQRDARTKLIHLLIKSRCKFGSDESAAEFVAAADTIEKLKKRRVMLRDAMELEGLDMVEDVDESGGRDGEDGGADLAPLDWYKPAGEGGIVEPDLKRAKTD